MTFLLSCNCGQLLDFGVLCFSKMYLFLVVIALPSLNNALL